MFGAIIPDPLVIPPTENVSFRTSACFSARSVVMTALAARLSASSLRLRSGATRWHWSRMRGRSRYLPMTPVLATPTSPGSTPIASAAITAISCASR